MNVAIPNQRDILRVSSYTKQAMIHMEECGELIQAISKMRRAKRDGIPDARIYDNLVEEVADVLICMEQIMEMYDIKDWELQRMLDKKQARLEERVLGHERKTKT